MWLVSCDGDDGGWLGGKRVWLRPGATYLFGRTSGNARGPNGEQIAYINHTAVSRKHLLVQIGQVAPGASAQVDVRSSVTVTDGSKSGTDINGASLIGQSMTLDGTDFRITLGKSPVKLRLEWHPVVLSFTGGISKEAKANGTALAEERQKLEALDIKLVTEYIANQTTHVVTKKRNTAIALRGFLEGKWVVGHNYVDALAAVGEKDDLEQDFDGKWPQEAEHIVAAGSEPDPCPDDTLRPRPERATMFEGYSFVTLEDGQYSTLSPVIAAGGGKLFHYEYEAGTTATQEFTDYLKKLAGKSDSSSFLLSQEPAPGGIVIIRPSKASSGRDQKFMSDIDTALNQRSIEQSELLSVILHLDASILRKPLRNMNQSTVIGQTSHGAPSTSITDSSPLGLPPRSTRGNPPTQPGQEEQRQAEAPPVPATKPPRRTITQRQFKGFADFDDEPISQPPSQQAPPSHQPGQREGTSRSQPNERSQRDASLPQGAQKRPAPVEDEEDNETEQQLLERLLPGQALLKRQKTEAAAKASRALPKPAKIPEESPVKKTEKPKGKGKAKTDPDAQLKARMLAKREAQEEAYRKDDDVLDMSEEALEKIKAEVVSFDLPERPALPVPTETGEGKGKNWDPRWEGRPNYKKFRRRGTEKPRETDSQDSQSKVVVTLAEYRPRGHGSGNYWLLDDDIDSQSQSQSQSRSASGGANNTSFARGDNDDEEETAFRRRIRVSREQDADAAAADAGIDTNTRAGGTQSTLATETQRRAAGKRPAATQLSGTAKKARQATATSSRFANVSEDEDPSAFKRKRR
ncbi:Nibrin [Pseudocercospora fuligena]|uniref:Nibrin n=1 Tax=Pseudocercospora fuligena TaxID=685502 RepID=A0A8H6VJA2_9PEZI|nr:Nibrin [Pseudocercospora fuligena]